MTETTEHTHLTDTDTEHTDAVPSPWCRVYIDHPDHMNERGDTRIPKLLGGGSREHCERVLKKYRDQHFAATQWPAKIVEIPASELGRDPKVVFE